MNQVHKSLVLEIGEQNGAVLVTISAVVRVGENSRSRVLSAGSYRDTPAAYRAARDFFGSQVIDGAEELVTRVAEPPPAPASTVDPPF